MLLAIFLKSQLYSKSNGPGLSFKTIFRHRNYFMSSVSTDGKDRHGFKLEKVGPFFSRFNAISEKSPKNIMVSAP